MSEPGKKVDAATQKRVDELAAEVDNLRRLAHSVISQREEDMRRYARELHNLSSQTLTQLALLLHDLKPAAGEKTGVVDEALTLVHQISGELRNICQDAGLSMLEHIGLADSLDWLLARFRQETGIDVDYQTPAEDEGLPLSLSLAAFRIAEEFLATCPRRPGVPPVKIAVAYGIKAGTFAMDISGREIGKLASERLFAIAERARMAGGTVSVKSSVGGSIRLHVTIPL